jgi:chromosomal replication initiation ATPase DnaA
MSANPWDLVLRQLRTELDAEEFRRWFTSTAYASDSGDQITVWVPTESDRRHLTRHYQDSIDRALSALGRAEAQIRFVVSGFGDDEEDDGED